MGCGSGWCSGESECRGRATKCNHFHKREYNNGSFGIKFFSKETENAYNEIRIYSSENGGVLYLQK
jgi:hypothetical protein